MGSCIELFAFKYFKVISFMLIHSATTNLNILDLYEVL